MGANIGLDVGAMRKMSLKELRGKYAEVFGEATQSRHKQYLLRRIAWQLQANAEGGLSERAQQRAKELAIQEELLFLPPTDGRHGPIHERAIRPICAEINWRKQRRLWGALKLHTQA